MVNHYELAKVKMPKKAKTLKHGAVIINKIVKKRKAAKGSKP
jgi:hypothetical protein